VKRAAPIAFVFGAAALAALVGYAGIDDIARALANLGVGGLVIVALIHLPVIALLGTAWWFLGRDMAHASAWKFMWARFVRESAAEVLPFSQLGGFVIGARALNLSGVRALPVSVSMLLDLVLELAAKLPYVLAGLLLLLFVKPDGDLSRGAMAGVAFTIVLLAFLVFFRARIRDGLERAAAGLARRWPALGLGGEADIRPMFEALVARDGRLLQAFITHVVCWSLGAFETWVMLRLIGVAVTPAEALMIDSLVSGLRTFGFVVPAALGVQEGAYVLVCALFGIAPAEAVALSLVRRARELGIGIPGLAAWQGMEGRRAFAKIEQQRSL
jgi:putative membrane protein